MKKREERDQRQRSQEKKKNLETQLKKEVKSFTVEQLQAYREVQTVHDAQTTQQQANREAIQTDRETLQKQLASLPKGPRHHRRRQAVARKLAIVTQQLAEFDTGRHAEQLAEVVTETLTDIRQGNVVQQTPGAQSYKRKRQVYNGPRQRRRAKLMVQIVDGSSKLNLENAVHNVQAHAGDKFNTPVFRLSAELCECGGELQLEPDTEMMVCQKCQSERSSELVQIKNMGFGGSINMHHSKHEKIPYFHERMSWWMGEKNALTKKDMALVRKHAQPCHHFPKEMRDLLKSLNFKKDKVKSRFAAIGLLRGRPLLDLTVTQYNDVIEFVRYISAAYVDLRNRNDLPPSDRVNFLRTEFLAFKAIQQMPWQKPHHFDLFRRSDNRIRILSDGTKVLELYAIYRRCWEECRQHGIRYIPPLKEEYENLPKH